MNITHHIDAVITWVDGEDPTHINKRTASRFVQLSQDIGSNAAATRFNQRDEISVCVRSILQYAPWIRYIFIVTDSQIPLIYHQLQDTKYANKLKIIDHRLIFRDYLMHLPTFNSLAIESMLWRIPGLSENFIYFNDDCLLLRSVNPEDFFKDDNIIIRGSWKTQAHRTWSHWFKKSWSYLLNQPCGAPSKLNDHRQIQERSASLLGYRLKFFHLPHIPFALKKSLFNRYFTENPQVLEDNISWPFRTPALQTWSLSVIIHLAIQKKIVVYDRKLQAIMVHGEYHDSRKFLSRLARACKQKHAAFLCIQSLDQASLKLQKQCFAWLDQQIMSAKALIQRG